MSLKLKYSQVKWALMELLIICYLSVHFFEGITSRIWYIILGMWIVWFTFSTIKKGLMYKKLYWYPVLVLVILTFVTAAYNREYANNSFFMLRRVAEVALYALTIALSIECEEELIHIWRPLFIGGVLAATYQLANIDYASLSNTIASNALRTSLSNKIFVNTYAYQALISLFAGFKYFFVLYKKGRLWKAKTMLWMVGTALILVGMLLTGSRKVIPALVCFFVVLLCYGKRHFWRVVLIAFALYLGLNAVIQIPALYNTIGWRIEMVLDSTDDASGQERADLRKDAISTGLTHPFGVGLDNSKYYSTTREVYAHNNYAEFFADFGFVGFLAYYGFYAYMAYKILCKMKEKRLNQSVEKNFYLAVLLSSMFTEYYQIVYYNFSYHVVIVAITLFIQYTVDSDYGTGVFNQGFEME